MPVLRRIASLATCVSSGGQTDIGLLSDAALVWDSGTIQWVGPERKLPAEYRDQESLDADGKLVIPGLIDCHTHLAFGGWRAEEFGQRILGKSYQEIAAGGGGIASTVAQTRAATTDALLARCRSHLSGMARLGVTTIEAKSGYGLSLAEELRLLGIYRDLAAGPQRIVPTLLAAHTVPPEFQTHRAEYLELVIQQIIPQAAAQGLARFCDVFVETGAFSVEEARQVLQAGKAHGLLPKLHADQLSAGGGAGLAAELQAVSADHLECISEAGISALRQAGVVAVSLPFASLYLGHSPLPARQLIAAGVPVAVATDFNPGSAPSYHLPVAMTLACTMQRMTPAEVLLGATQIAAKAIGVERETGSLERGKSADFAIIDAESVDQWLYHLRDNACVMTVAQGKVIWQANKDEK